mmetsp:Transcript_1034/g.3797  ORF Transcript_1034/g.3797 Transcript_1034/m.3797 type:complete len:289 (+) Transcript_1034:1254-2120(+)
MNKARAKEIRILQPPEKLLVELCMENRSGPFVSPFLTTVKPKPCRIFDALASAVSSPFSFSWSYVFVNACDASISVPVSSSLNVNWFISLIKASFLLSSACAIFSINCSYSIFFCLNSMSSTSAATTDSNAVLSSPTTSCSTNKMSINSGTGILRLANNFINVVLPVPFGPTIPYRLPCAIVMFVSVNNGFPLTETEKLSILISREFAICAIAWSSIAGNRTLNASSSSRIASSFAIASFLAISISFFLAFAASLSEGPSNAFLVKSLSTFSSTSSSSEEDGKSIPAK